MRNALAKILLTLAYWLAPALKHASRRSLAANRWTT